MMHIHLIGIGGSGLSAIAQVLLERGFQVSGSDRQISPLIEHLRAAGVEIMIGHKTENVGGAELVLRSSAILESNPEVQAALKAGIPVLKRIDFLTQITAGFKTIAVAGTHGKTTTTGMIAWLLTDLGIDPSYIIGGVSINLNTNAHSGSGSIFVIEADEYDRAFLGLNPYIAVVTNIEHDHPDCFPTPDDYYLAFHEFVSRMVGDGILLVCGDDPGAMRLASQFALNRRVMYYGLNSGNYHYYARRLRPNHSGGYCFDMIYRTQPESDNNVGQEISQISLQVPGEHNVRNALAALAVADVLGLSMNQAVKAIEHFRGSKRRFEIRGEARGVIFIDDYAHHPTEIRATLQAARDSFPDRRIWAVWQPHTYSRTHILMDDFAQAFGDAENSPVDRIVVTDIYAAREDLPADGFSAASVVQAMNHPQVRYIPELQQVIDYLLDHLQPGDVLLVLSAGDADQISTQALALRQIE